jgi:hypothetical protein
MSLQSSFAIGVILAGLFGWQPLLAKDAPTSDTQLLERLETAVKAKDKAAILELYNWDGVPAWVRTNVNENDVNEWITRELVNAKLSSLPKDFSSTGEHRNMRYHLSLPAVGIIELGSGIGTGI